MMPTRVADPIWESVKANTLAIINFQYQLLRLTRAAATHIFCNVNFSEIHAMRKLLSSRKWVDESLSRLLLLLLTCVWFRSNKNRILFYYVVNVKHTKKPFLCIFSTFAKTKNSIRVSCRCDWWLLRHIFWFRVMFNFFPLLKSL